MRLRRIADLCVGRQSSSIMKGNDAIAAAAYMLVLAGSIFAVVRAFGAVFSPRVRASIARHPIVHAIWFIIAVVVLYDVLTRISASIGPRPSPNRVAGRFTLPAPTPPDMRVRIRRFRLA
jgi:hypothetical protein